LVVELPLEVDVAGFKTTAVHAPHWSVMLPFTCPFAVSPENQ
jgi:hypothetical protein